MLKLLKINLDRCNKSHIDSGYLRDIHEICLPPTMTLCFTRREKKSKLSSCASRYDDIAESLVGHLESIGWLSVGQTRTMDEERRTERLLLASLFLVLWISQGRIGAWDKMYCLVRRSR